MMKKIAFWLGVAIVVASHLYMLTVGMPVSQVVAHSIANLVAAALIIYGAM